MREVRFPRVCHRSGSVQGPCFARALFSFRASFCLVRRVARHAVPGPTRHGQGRRSPRTIPHGVLALGRETKSPRPVADNPSRLLFYFELSTVDGELPLKKMSGRWGDRPLGRGGWRVLQPEASSQLPPVPLRSRAAERDTGAIRPKPFCSGSRNQLPITVAILLPATLRVDSPAGSFFSVLPAASDRLLLVPMYFRKFFAPPVRIERSLLRSSA